MRTNGRNGTGRRMGIGKILQLAAALGLALLAGRRAPALAGEVTEYAVKAAYLVDFAKFVTWPAKAYGDDEGAIVIGILGDDPFGPVLDGMAEGKTLDGHALVVRRFESFDGSQTAALRRCHILFIAYSEKDRLQDILRAIKGAPVLTVSEIDRFPLKGGMIQFDQDGRRITLDINPSPARAAGLELSSKLLQVAKIYGSE